MAGDERKIVRCSGCGLRVWEDRLESVGCPMCAALEQHAHPRLLTPR